MERLSATMENYLKTIYNICCYGNVIAHVSDIAVRMKVSKASACKATSLLAEKGLITKENYRGLFLTSEGLKHAALISDRHKIIRRFLNKILRVDSSVADQDACNFEHTISLESLQSMYKYLENYDRQKDRVRKKFMKQRKATMLHLTD